VLASTSSNDGVNGNIVTITIGSDIADQCNQYPTYDKYTLYFNYSGGIYDTVEKFNKIVVPLTYDYQNVPDNIYQGIDLLCLNNIDTIIGGFEMFPGQPGFQVNGNTPTPTPVQTNLNNICLQLDNVTCYTDNYPLLLKAISASIVGGFLIGTIISILRLVINPRK
jgi:hypothetical protein